MTGDTPHLDGSTGDALGDGGAGVTLESVSKSFDDLSAVDGIDIRVDRGELLVILGPSGCGKTTLLRLIAGLEVVDDGTIHIGDADVTQTLPQNRRVSMVFQNYALYPHMTVRENLRFPLGKTNLATEERRSRVETVADLLEITEYLDNDPDQLSGGQRQRVALGRTIIREPAVFLMDEPLSNLDANLRVQTRGLIRDLHDRLGTTTIYVTHDQEEALSLADRIAVMRDGAIEQRDTAESVYTNPVNEFVAEFVGDPAMNIHPLTHRFGDRIVLDDTIPVSGVSLPASTARVGVRPEDINRTTAASGVESVTDPIDLLVDVVEPIGPRYEVTLRAGETRLTMLTDSVDATPGDTVRVVFDTDRLYAFDATGVRL